MIKNILVILMAIIAMGCTIQKIYLVRHAEKGTIPKGNPQLTVLGEQRAIDLATYLSSANVGAIYSTNTTRTIATAKPTSIQQNIALQLYNNDTTLKLFDAIIKHKKNTLVVGHSNTVLAMLDSLQVKHITLQIADSTYNNMFVLTIKKHKMQLPLSCTLQEIKYGKQ